ncbi:MAG: pyridoxal-phosphate dependent enzyme [Bryobacteraceae bacterium]
MANSAWLECAACSARFDLAPEFFGCPICRKQGHAAPLEVAYDLGMVGPHDGRGGAAGIWRWTALLPPVSEASRITLAEGGTPLIPVRDGRGDFKLLLKNETANPTWSWKDRPNCISVSMAREFGFRRTAAISTGNHGCAVSAYSAAAGLEPMIFCHPEAPVAQLALMNFYGARVIRGGNQEALFEQVLRQGNHFPCSIYCPRPGYANPYGIEGFKTIAFELYEQLGHSVPDRVFVPAGSGDGIYGVWKGFRELLALGWISNAPRMIACQTTGADSAFRAFKRGSHHAEPLESASTVALSISERVIGDHALRAVYESGGSVLAVSDEAVLEAMRYFGRQGVALEAASSVPLACVRKVAREATPGEVWVMIGSGSAVKWGNLAESFQMPPCYAPEYADLTGLNVD